MLFHGIYKLTHGVAWIAGPLGGVGLPAWLSYGVYVAEVLAPLLVIVGLWARPAALVIAFDMVMAIFLARRGDVAKRRITSICSNICRSNALGGTFDKRASV